MPKPKTLDVWSQTLMEHPYRVIRRMRYGPEFYMGAPQRQSGCVVGQAFAWRHGVWSRRMALRIVRSLRITATRATFFGRPRAVS